MDFGKEDLGSALLLGTLPRAVGAPPPPPRHLYPMLDFYKETCTGDLWSAPTSPLGDYDPMIGEALATCEAAMTKPMSFSPPGSPSLEEQRSPVYVANCGAN